MADRKSFIECSLLIEKLFRKDIMSGPCFGGFFLQKKDKGLFCKMESFFLLSLHSQKREIFDCQSIFYSICVHYTYLRSADESWSRTRSATPSRPALDTDRTRLSIFRVRFFRSFFQGLCFLEQRIKQVLKGQLTCRSPLRGQFCSPTLP